MAKGMNKAVLAEMTKIQAKDGGLLQAEAVVRFAANPKTALHKKFTWDNRKAGHEYRLWQARELIGVFVTVLKPNTQPVRAFVSLRADRKLPGGGYRAIVDVVSDADMRRQLLAEALDDAERWQGKYAALTELKPVFKEIARVRAKQARNAA